MSRYNQNSIAIPGHSRPLVAGTHTASTIDNVQAWYGIIILEEAVIESIEFIDETVSYAGITLAVGISIFGNIKSVTITSGIIQVGVHK